MQPNSPFATNIEKLVSLVSYYTMGIAGLVWVIISFLLKKKTRFFLMYNIAQSMLIAIFLAILNLLLEIILQIIIAIPFLSSIGIKINMFLSSRILIFGLAFNKIETLVFILLLYISFGVIFGRILYVPLFTNAMKIIMRSYR